MINPSTIADPASAGAVLALEGDPFYRSITVDFEADLARRHSVLADYFSLSIEEGRNYGRCVHLPDPTPGVAVWHLPQTSDRHSRIAAQKRKNLARTLGPKGLENYYRIVGYMHSRAEHMVSPEAWYLSILAINPAQQGRGLGRQLLAPTLAEADGRGVECFLETFSERAHNFYRRLGFHERAKYMEPTAGAEYVLMVRASGGS